MALFLLDSFDQRNGLKYLRECFPNFTEFILWIKGSEFLQTGRWLIKKIDIICGKKLIIIFSLNITIVMYCSWLLNKPVKCAWESSSLDEEF